MSTKKKKRRKVMYGLWDRRTKDLWGGDGPLVLYNHVATGAAPDKFVKVTLEWETPDEEDEK